MITAASIKRQIANITDDKPFSIREFLHHGKRAVVDNVFHRLTKAGILTRVAQGLYIKADSAMPSLEEIVQVKVAAFHKIIVTHGAVAAEMLKIAERKINEHIYAVSGCSSTFRTIHGLVRLIGTSSRKMTLKDTTIGLAIRALWYLGREACTVPVMLSTALKSFDHKNREMFRQSASLMPAWLNNHFHWPLLSTA